MLIKSQDKKLLVPINLGTVAVEPYKDAWIVCINSGYLKETWWKMGTFSTEQKALQVLEGISNTYCRSLREASHVFDIPQDDEA